MVQPSPSGLIALIALMMEVVQISETLVNINQSTRRYNPDDSHLRVSTLLLRNDAY
jgi:hypothetical protein